MPRFEIEQHPRRALDRMPFDVIESKLALQRGLSFEDRREVDPEQLIRLRRGPTRRVRERVRDDPDICDVRLN